MTVGIAVRDDAGITHWASYSSKNYKVMDIGRMIAQELRRTDKPALVLACEGWDCQARHVNQVKRVSTRVTSVTCMTCIIQM